MKTDSTPKHLDLTPDTLRAIKKLAIEECANWVRKGPFGIQNSCWAREKSSGGVCTLFINPPKPCKYFQEFVLPLAGYLSEEYFQMSKEEGNGESTRPESSDFRSGAGEGAGSSQVIHVPAAPRGVSVGKHIKKTILPRYPLHGMAAKKQAPESGRGV